LVFAFTVPFWQESDGIRFLFAPFCALHALRLDFVSFKKVMYFKLFVYFRVVPDLICFISLLVLVF